MTSTGLSRCIPLEDSHTLLFPPIAGFTCCSSSALIRLSHGINALALLEPRTAIMTDMPRRLAAKIGGFGSAAKGLLRDPAFGEDREYGTHTISAATILRM